MATLMHEIALKTN